MVKEGGVQTLMQVAFIVLVGAMVSNVVCLLIWPQRATEALQNNMTQTLDSFSTLLGMLTQTFLLEEPHGFSSDKLQRAVSNHQASFTFLIPLLVLPQSFSSRLHHSVTFTLRRYGCLLYAPGSELSSTMPPCSLT